MMPDECASMRSIARWVLPVLVGPSTAVTPAPRARASRATGEEKEIGITCPAGGEGFRAGPYPPLLYHNAPRQAPPHKRWNESGTNRARIADSITVKVRSRQYVAVWRTRATISGNEARRTPIVAICPIPAGAPPVIAS